MMKDTILTIVVLALCVSTILSNYRTAKEIAETNASISSLAGIMQEIGKIPAQSTPPSTITNTSESNPVVTVHAGDASKIWDDQMPHTVEDVARYLDVTPDTVRSYIEKWRTEGHQINKSESNQWRFPEGFTPYKP